MILTLLTTAKLFLLSKESFSLIFKTLLRKNFHTTRDTYLKCTTRWFLVHTATVRRGTFSSWKSSPAL